MEPWAMVGITTLNPLRLSSAMFLVSRWLSLAVRSKQKDCCYLVYEIQILLYFLSQSGFTVWLLKKYQRMITCCLCLSRGGSARI
uniref:Uncharacterized protein n=1 Tax=Lotus japonicus TaxID=34305 RepID=I3SJ14_LOTJA|nr:unknown [Lotus japonicus]